MERTFQGGKLAPSPVESVRSVMVLVWVNESMALRVQGESEGVRRDFHVGWRPLTSGR